MTLTGYLLSVVTANLTSAHCAPLLVGEFVMPAGTVFAGMSLTARDFLHDALGARGVGVGIVAAAGLSATVASPRIAVASTVAFTVSEIADSLLYARLRRRTWLGAVAVSNAAGLVIDSVLFLPLGFGSTAAVPGQIVGKTIATLITLATLRIASPATHRVVIGL